MNASDVLNTPVEDLNISVRTLIKFKKFGINTLGQIIDHTESDMAFLIKSRNSFELLIEEMRKRNLRFKSHFE